MGNSISLQLSNDETESELLMSQTQIFTMRRYHQYQILRKTYDFCD